MQEVQAINACPACNFQLARTVATKDGKTGQPLHVVCCSRCGLGRIDPMPEERTLSHWYKNHYRQAYKSSVKPSQRHVLRAARLAIERYEWFKQRIPSCSVSAAMDLGASGGEFVHLMNTLGIDAIGVEPHSGYVRHASDGLGLRVLAGTLHDHLPYLENHRFDLITMFHVLEHMVNPIGTLCTLKNLLSEHGLLFIEVPNVGAQSSPTNTFFGAHTLYFTAHSMQQVVRAAGFEIVADNFGDVGNLSVVLRKASDPAALSWHYDNELLESQSRRRWSSYLVRSLVSGKLRRAFSQHIEEKMAASRYSSEKELLEDLHGDYSRRYHVLKDS